MLITSFCVNYMLLVQITLFKGIITSFAFLVFVFLDGWSGQTTVVASGLKLDI